MSRRKFIESYGATCNNWATSWSFVNHAHKFVIFGAWNTGVKGNEERILSENWRLSDRGRVKPGYTQAIAHIHLVEEKGYRLMTFPMEFSDENMDEKGNGPAKIKSFKAALHPRKLKKSGEEWLALPFDSENKEKIARICWNSEAWQEPSGVAGKSKNPKAYERVNGYGHEEWLLDMTKVIDGYHYAYVQAVGSHRNTYLGDTYDISFYSINSDTKRHWWLGTIRNVLIVGPLESKRIFGIYKKNGWYDEMISQLKSVGANVKAFKRFTTPETFAVIKFKLEDLELLDEPLEFAHDDPAVTSNYYNLKDKKLSPKLMGMGKFVFKHGHNAKIGKAKGRSRYRRDQSDGIDLYHNRIQTELFKYLTSLYGNNVGTENPTGKGTFIDAVVRHGTQYSFYEIKTSYPVRQCVRDALGQLLEYAYFGNSIPIKELVIVSPHKTTHDVTMYLENLREKYSLPIVYRQFDMDSSTLLE